MDSVKASRIVVMSAGMTYGIGFLNSASRGKMPSMRFVIGAGVVFLTLSALSDIEPDLAAPMALAVVTTAFFSNGSAVLDYVNGRGEITQRRTRKVVRHRMRTPRADVGQVPGLSH